MDATRMADAHLLRQLGSVIASPLPGVASEFSRLLASQLTHSALVIFTEDCTGRPQKKAGVARITDRVTVAELDVVRAEIGRRGGSARIAGTIAGDTLELHGWIASTGALLLLTDPGEDLQEAVAVERRALIAEMWELVALSIRHQVSAASPEYLRDSRRASAERAAIIAELTDAHSTALELVLAALRSREASDHAARQAATELAVAAMVKLRSISDRDRQLATEPVATAFARLRDELRPLVRFGDLDLQFVEPPTNGRELPGEVAHAARAIVRGAVLTQFEQRGVGRLRIQWDCDGSNLLINLRDDGPGDLAADHPSMRRLRGRVTALDGSLRVVATSGWGSEILVALPLEPSGARAATDAWELTAREERVLELVTSGMRNRAIAVTLGISENTAKFHVANLLHKTGASSRVELAAKAASRVGSPPRPLAATYPY